VTHTGAGQDHHGPARLLLFLRDRFEAMRTCDFCGRQETDAAMALAWSTAVENGRAKTYCAACSREHVRAMEGQLDSEHW
jgi:hypothetical protein